MGGTIGLDTNNIAVADDPAGLNSLTDIFGGPVARSVAEIAHSFAGVPELLEVRDWKALEEEWAERNETPSVPESDGSDE